MKTTIHFFGLSIAAKGVGLLSIVFIISVAHVLAQRTTSAANGGFGRQTPSSKSKTAFLPDLVKFRPVVKDLGLSEDVLKDQYNAIRERSSRPRVRDIIVSYLMLSPRPIAERVSAVDSFVQTYTDGASFFYQFRSFLKIDESEFKERKRQAEHALRRR